MKKVKKILDSLYEGFTKISEKKLKEIESKIKTGELSVFNIASISDYARGARRIRNVKSKRYDNNGLKNFLNNTSVNGRSSGKEFSHTSLILENIVDFSGDDSVPNSKRRRVLNRIIEDDSKTKNIHSPTPVSQIANQVKSSNVSKSAAVRAISDTVSYTSQATTTSTATTSTTSTATTSTTTSTTYSSGGGGGGGY